MDGSDTQKTIFKTFGVSNGSCLNVLGLYRLSATFTTFTEELSRQADENIQECKQSIKETIGGRACGFCRDTHDGSIGVCSLLSNLKKDLL